MKKQYITFLMVIIGICTAESLEQPEGLVILPKNKKKYVSKEQCIDVKIESIVLNNLFNRSLNRLRQINDNIQADGLGILSDYADGEKDCFFKQATKIELTKYHEKTVQLNNELERYNQEIQRMQQKLESLLREMLKIQSELKCPVS